MVIVRIPSNIYCGMFSSEPCATLAYLEPTHIQNMRNIRNHVKHHSIFLETCAALEYLEFWYIQKLRNIYNPANHL